MSLDEKDSTTRYAFDIGSKIKSWSSKKQPQDEYKPLCSATYEVIWLREILKDIGERKKY